MFLLNSQERLTVYANPARDLTAVQGKSGVVYPFYKSSGANSKSDQTWSPWMGYFDHHPKQETDPSFKGQVYMVKPSPSILSEEAKGIIKRYLGDNANNFIQRMGNDEALAISCSLGGGDWEKYPRLRAEIMQAESTKKFIIPELQVGTTLPLKIAPLPPTNEPIDFAGKKCVGKIVPAQANIASAMETATALASTGYVTAFSVQDKKQFPTTNQVNAIMAAKMVKPIPAEPAISISIPKTSKPPVPGVAAAPDPGTTALQLEQARKIREKYLSKLGIVKDKKPIEAPPNELGSGGMKFFK